MEFLLGSSESRSIVFSTERQQGTLEANAFIEQGAALAFLVEG